LIITELLNTYDEEITSFEHLQDDLYQVYVEIDGSELTYVVVLHLPSWLLTWVCSTYPCLFN